MSRPRTSPGVALATLLFVTLVSSPARSQRAGWDRGLDAQIDSVRTAWRVPGIAIAIVSRGRVVSLKGYGFKDLEAKVPVTPKTQFAIGSVTKSFAVTGLAAQVKQGKLEWDRPVREYLADFRMYDPVATERMTTRDLVTHRSGLPRHDLMWGPGIYARQQLYDRLRYLEPTREFRSYWQYQNLMFATAGYLSGKLNGSDWETVVRDAIFRPLGMTNANLSVNDMQRSADFSWAYVANEKDSVFRTPFRNLDAIGPAGSINASVEDMAKYLIMHMQQGRIDEQEIITAKDAREMQSPQMVIARTPAQNPDDNWSELGDEAYGMGLFIGNYRGRRMVHHGGNIDGFSAELNFLPNDSIGVVVLTNMNGTATRDFIPFLIYDRLLGIPPVDWNKRYLARASRQRMQASAARAREEAARKPNTRPGHLLDDYAGVYTHPAYGDITITKSGDALGFAFMGMSFPMEHFHFDVFRTAPSAANPLLARFRWRINFQTDQDGIVTSLTAPAEPALKPIAFTRKKS